MKKVTCSTEDPEQEPAQESSPKKSILQLKKEFDGSLIPENSKLKYIREWDFFQSFLNCFDPPHEINMESIQGYLMTQHLKKYSPSTIACKSSMIKKMCQCNGIPVDILVWGQVNSWLNNLTKNFIPASADEFTLEDVVAYVEHFINPTPLEVQKQTMAIIAFSVGLRASEN